MKTIALSFGTLFFLGCGTGFEHLRGVTRIEIRDNLNKPLATIENPLHIERVMQFVNARSTGWKVPWYGVPVPTLIANFYAEKTFLGHFGAGGNFFACHRQGGFYSREAEPVELQQFEALVGGRRKP